MVRECAQFLRSFVVLFLALFSVSAIHPQDLSCPKDGRPDCPRAVVFFHSLRAALAENNHEGVAKMMQYPFLTSINHKKVRISTPTKLLLHFDEVFDKGVRCEIAGAADQDVWGNSNGFTIKDGAIWFDDLIPPAEKIDPNSPDFWNKGSFKVITVNNDAYYPCLDREKTGK